VLQHRVDGKPIVTELLPILEDFTIRISVNSANTLMSTTSETDALPSSGG
jgi:hypothetical protein